MDKIIRRVRYQPFFIVSFKKAYKPSSSLKEYVVFFMELFKGYNIDFYDGRVYAQLYYPFNTWEYDYNLKFFRRNFYLFIISIFQYKFICEKNMNDETKGICRRKLAKMRKLSFCYPFELEIYWKIHIMKGAKDNPDKFYFPLFDRYINILTGGEVLTQPPSHVKYNIYFQKKYYIKSSIKKERILQRKLGSLFLYDNLFILPRTTENEILIKKLLKIFHLGLVLGKRIDGLQRNIHYFNTIILNSKSKTMKFNEKNTGLLLINLDLWRYYKKKGVNKLGLIWGVKKNSKILDWKDEKLFHWVLRGIKMSYGVDVGGKTMKKDNNIFSQWFSKKEKYYGKLEELDS